AVLDSTLDRVADWAVLLGVIIYFFMRNSAMLLADGRYDTIALIGMGAAIYAIMTSFVTSYIRARAESVGAEAKGGIATRSDRLTIILVGMAINGLTHQDAWLMATMCVLALLGTVTIFQRIHEARASIEASLDAPAKA
ncbi:MAG: CDP-alcohol phosphatidyltransferase family protein, partial [Bifidobacterium criceti]|nr:CDP-alcohol phosphatidyltransferase family protein [Bifidobacterium criceti]